MKGTVLSERYELIEVVGEGGMAVVYKARCKILDRIVAVKILKNEYSNDSNFVDKFKTEALSVARISHPNIVNVYDVGQEQNIYYIVMEFVEGKTLEKVINESAPLDADKAVDIAIMICDALQHAHNKGVIHRDIKPHNILLTEEGMVKVADFGIARAVTNATITFGGNIVGSVHYISPEQAKGEPVDTTTDLYSLGCVLYEILTGKVPFDAESPITVALKHIHDEPVNPSNLNEEIPPSLEAIIIKAMEKLAVNRFHNAEEMRNALLDLNTNVLSSHQKQRYDKTLIMSPKDLEGNESEVKEKRKIRPVGIALITVAVLGLLSGVFFILTPTLFPEDVVVPDLDGMTLQEARGELNDLGLGLDIIDEQFSDEFEQDTIMSQNPREGQLVKQGRDIRVIISKGPQLKSVPNLVGLDLADARISLRNQGLTVGDVDEIFDDQYEENTVISQSPESGTELNLGENVNVIVSKGATPNRISVPNLIGVTISNATEILQQRNLDLGDVTEKESDEYFADQIIEQEIDAGVLVEEESEIDVVVSTGPGPDARTQTLEFDLPDEQDFYKVIIKVNDIRGEREFYNELHSANDTVSVGVSYFGSGSAIVTLNNQDYKTFNL
ncbi:Serine/threonine protein kinase PrkC, regulator of stationary phase [Candidatus Syntrophocurvum alkaliphilum]|uniref:non-specific serine/threonine protein kinase n=1 Tax=Candidatus Syntrophocurvum alkaliphilum TaxID=2293317 RepID=A0A6I6DJN8_9FIRM|nr:PASTA domain-containing protein [Candidatus Syntrophocurvum alkaliphilum]QGT99611.1 Serine/threonine protein kinase PrkC, regulator of stationary phase [Candidatus Syntrophocurvum alkaliphilum]